MKAQRSLATRASTGRTSGSTREPTLSAADASLKAPSVPRLVLPAAYLPMAKGTLAQGESFGPVEFVVRLSSHQKQLDYIGEAAPEARDVLRESLTPFETWSWARVLSSARFGRLNEVVSVEGSRLVAATARPDEPLFGSVHVTNLVVRKHFTVATFASETRNTGGHIVARGIDKMLLAHDSEPRHLRTVLAAVTTTPTPWSGPWPLDASQFKVSMRFKWPEPGWRNNIHTASYAALLGYPGPLVEGPCVADILYAVLCSRGAQRTGWVAWKYKYPLVEGLEAGIAIGDGFNRAFLVAQVNGEAPPVVLVELWRQGQ